ncbi:MAG: alpha/beta hydrolase [Calditrichaceae bacterium]|nr:alpha/beta hydrolase [Calditrichaceae bacterium]MBN2710297.1 alpha/beta hydrolase [Calditrichaceae bacterium]RQV93001.1 MAG: alpha/beta hydrolase [Calditrichota bacterium]
MTILEQIKNFSDRFGKSIIVNDVTWRYYRLGTGAPVLWLTGGMRRAALGFAFMERLAKSHIVIAPDYPPVSSINDFMGALDAILQNEDITTFTLAGQSYGGMLAQAYLAHKGPAVERLILSSAGPVNAIGKAWIPALNAVVALVRILPEKFVKKLLTGELLKHVNVPAAERAEWLEIINELMKNELSRADAVSHFTVAVDLLKQGLAAPAAYQYWPGRVIVMSAKNDPTQRKRDFPLYERLFGRPVETLDMGSLGHTAALFNPEKYVELLEQALS